MDATRASITLVDRCLQVGGTRGGYLPLPTLHTVTYRYLRVLTGSGVNGAVSKTGRTALHEAAALGHYQVRPLLSVTYRYFLSLTQRTALHEAAALGHYRTEPKLKLN